MPKLYPYIHLLLGSAEGTVHVRFDSHQYNMVKFLAKSIASKGDCPLVAIVVHDKNVEYAKGRDEIWMYPNWVDRLDKLCGAIKNYIESDEGD